MTMLAWRTAILLLSVLCLFQGAIAACTAGNYCPSDSSSLPCPAGSFCPVDSDAPQDCPAGSYCPAAASAAIPCPIGAYCSVSASTPTACPAGSYCSGSASSADGSGQCQAGYYCPEKSAFAFGNAEFGAVTTSVTGLASLNAFVNFNGQLIVGTGRTLTKVSQQGSSLYPVTGTTFTSISALAASGTNLFVLDSTTCGLYLVQSSASTLIVGGSCGFAEGDGTNAMFTNPTGLVVLSTGVMLIADTGNNMIRKVTASAPYTVSIHSGDARSDTTNGALIDARFNAPMGLTADGQDNVYVADSGNHLIRKISSSGQVTTLAGSSVGKVDATGTSAKFNAPKQLVWLAPTTAQTDGALIVVDSGNAAVRVIRGDVVKTVAGCSTAGTSTDGTGSSACFNSLGSVAVLLNNVELPTIYLGDSTSVRAIALSVPVTLCKAGYYCPAGSATENPNPCAVGSYCLAGASSANQALPCTAGYFCPQASATASGSGLCPAQYYCLAGANKALCQAGTYCLAGASATTGTGPCPVGSYCGVGTSAGTQCNAGIYCPTGSMAATTQCPAGYYCPAGSDRIACPGGAYCSGGASAIAGSGSCQAGYYCPAGSINATGAGQCVATTYCTAGSSSPKPCTAGNFCPNTPSTSQTSCTAGSYCATEGLSAGVACPVGSYCQSGASAAVSCLISKVCPTIGLSAGQACPVGSYCPSSGMSVGLTCESGSYCPSGSSIAATCLATKYCATPSTQVDCTAGAYCPVGTTSPIQCPAGSYCPAAVSVPVNCSASVYCPAGSSAAAGSGACTAGYYCPVGQPRQPCPIGAFCPSGAAIFSVCTAGSYCPVPQLAAATACPAGSYCAVTGLSTSILCPAGTYTGTTGRSVCVVTSVGYFTNTSGMSVQTPCPRGRVCPTTGLTVPALCPARLYCESTGLSNATSYCPAGSYCPEGSSSPVICPVGTLCAETALSTPNPCPAGLYCAGTGSVVATARCSSGTYCAPGSSSNNGVPCQPGYMCAIGSTTIQGGTETTLFTACPAGQYCPAGSTTGINTPIGSFAPSTGMSAAAQCTAGKYCASAGLSVETGACTGSYFCPAGSSSATTTQCPIGSFCPPGSGSPTICPAAAFCAAGVSVAAPCSSNCEMCTGSAGDQCVSCLSGNVLLNGTGCMATCPATYFASSVNVATVAVSRLASSKLVVPARYCLKCSALCDACTGSLGSQCTACSPGNFMLTGTGCLTECPIGYLSDRNNVCFLPTEHIKTQLQSDGSTFLVHVEGADAFRANSLIQSDCSFFITYNTSLNLFGSSPKCSWASSSVLRITASPDALGRAGHVMGVYRVVLDYVQDTVVQPSVLALASKAPNSQFPILSNPSLYGILYTVIQAPPAILTPSAVLVGNSKLGLCDAFSVDASSSTGSMGRPYSSVQWSLDNSVTATGFTAAQLTALSTSLSQASTSLSLSLQLLANMIPAGALFAIKLTLTNWMGASGMSSISFTKSTAPSLPIILSGVPYISLARSQDLSVSATTDYTLQNMCVALKSTALSVSFRWSQLSAWPSGVSSIGGVALSSLGAPQSNPLVFTPATPQLLVPARSLLVGSVYAFSVQLTTKLPLASGALQTVTSTSYIAVSVTASSLIAKIAGGDRTASVVDSQGSMTLDASASYDPDVATSASVADNALSFAWSCTLVASQAACPFSMSGAKLSVPNSQLQSALSNGDSKLSFSVTVSKGARSTTTAPVIVTLSQLALPSLSIQLLVPNKPSGFTRVNPDDKVALSAVAVASTKGLPLSAYTYRWQSTSSIMTLTESDARVGTALTSPTLVLLPGALVGGATYSFMVTLVNEQQPSLQVSANISFTVNAPPSSGQCSVSPASGVALTTSFGLSCSGFSDDPSDLPLTYAYNVLATNTISAYTLRSAQSVAAFSTALPAASPLSMTASICDVWGACTIVPMSATVGIQNVDNPEIVNGLATTVLSSLSSAQSSGDTSGAAGLVAALTGVLNAASSVSSASLQAANQNSSNFAAQSEAAAAATAQRAAVRTSLMSFLVDSSSVSTAVPTEQQLSQQVSMLSQVVSVPSEVTPAVQTQATAFAKSSIETALASSTQSLSASLSQAALGAIGSVVQAATLTAATSTSSGTTPAPTAAPQNVDAAAHALTISQTANSIIESVSRGQLIGAYPGETTVVSTPGITIAATRQTADSLAAQNASFAASDPTNSSATSSSVKLPKNILSAMANQPGSVDASLTIIKTNMYAFADSSDSYADKGVSPIVSFTLYDSSVTPSSGGHGEIPISGLKDTIEIVIPIPHDANWTVPAATSVPVRHTDEFGYTYIEVPSTNERVPGCRYWNTAANQWSGDGCTMVQRGADFIVCSCTHLTSFQASQLMPPFRPLGVQDILNFFDWQNIKNHPTTLIAIGVLVMLELLGTIIIMCRRHRNMMSRHETRRRLLDAVEEARKDGLADDLDYMTQLGMELGVGNESRPRTPPGAQVAGPSDSGKRVAAEAAIAKMLKHHLTDKKLLLSETEDLELTQIKAATCKVAPVVDEPKVLGGPPDLWTFNEPTKATINNTNNWTTDKTLPDVFGDTETQDTPVSGRHLPAVIGAMPIEEEKPQFVFFAPTASPTAAVQDGGQPAKFFRAGSVEQIQIDDEPGEPEPAPALFHLPSAVFNDASPVDPTIPVVLHRAASTAQLEQDEAEERQCLEQQAQLAKEHEGEVVVGETGATETVGANMALAALCGLLDPTSASAFIVPSTVDTQTVFSAQMLATARTEVIVSQRTNNPWFWLQSPQTWKVVKENVINNILGRHPLFSIAYHHPLDNYGTYQRLLVLFCMLYTFLAVNASFFQQGTNTIGSDLVIAFYTSLIVTPVGLIFPGLYHRAEILHAQEIRAAESPGYIRPRCAMSRLLLFFAHLFCMLWKAGAIFVTLVYGMQFDLDRNAMAMTLRAGGMSVSGRWLLACLESLGINWLLTAPLIASFMITIHTLLARRRIEVDLRQQLIADNVNQAKYAARPL